MGIDPACNVAGCVAQVAADDLHIFPCVNQQGRISVSQSVDGHFWQVVLFKQSLEASVKLVSVKPVPRTSRKD